jgi:hypothetical protein
MSSKEQREQLDQIMRNGPLDIGATQSSSVRCLCRC